MRLIAFILIIFSTPAFAVNRWPLGTDTSMPASVLLQVKCLIRTD
jgi:hypothetical protein